MSFLDTKREARILTDLSESIVSVSPAKRAVSLFGATKSPRQRAARDAEGAIEETDHEKVFRLIADRKVKEAVQLAARLINAGKDNGFLRYAGTKAHSDADKWFSRRAHSQNGDAEFVTITPELAQILIVNNEGNRQVKSPNLESITRDILDGRWRTNGESIIISSDGRLNDGQHRCYGVLLTGKPIRSAVSYGVDRNSMTTVDIGRKREGADRLGISGVPHSVRASALAGLVFEMQYVRKPTAAEVDDFYREHQSIIQTAITLDGSNIKGVGQAATGAASFYLLNKGYGEDDIRDFFSRIHNGEMMERRDPRMVLHRAARVDKVRLTREQWMKAFVQHFLAHKVGKRMSQPMYDITLDW